MLHFKGTKQYLFNLLEVSTDHNSTKTSTESRLEKPIQNASIFDIHIFDIIDTWN